MNSQQQQAIIERFVDGVNEGELDVVERWLTHDFYHHRPTADQVDQRTIVGQLLDDVRAAFPDLRLEASNFAAEGDTLTFELLVQGTHQSALWGAPASHTEIAWSSHVQARFVDDRFAFQWPNLTMPQLLPTLRSLDLIPAAEDMDKPTKYPVIIPEFLLKLFFTGQAADKACQHVTQIQVVEPTTDVCQDCVQLGDIWPALRMCLFCGFVGCCDTSKNKHMKRHYQETGHPLFRSIRLNERWVWCYEDNAFFSGRILTEQGKGV
ncbi:MAG: ester cyclase [Candidatus Promineifilaceae bacterium]|nr:ester cyclase [Candidatus Promineifilaceae bacterium]